MRRGGQGKLLQRDKNATRIYLKELEGWTTSHFLKDKSLQRSCAIKQTWWMSVSCVICEEAIPGMMLKCKDCYVFIFNYCLAENVVGNGSNMLGFPFVFPFFVCLSHCISSMYWFGLNVVYSMQCATKKKSAICSIQEVLRWLVISK